MKNGRLSSEEHNYLMVAQSTKKLEDKQEDQTSTLVSFAVFGCLVHSMYSVMLSGTQDILAGTRVPTTTILSAITVPLFLCEIITPYFLKKIPHIVLVSITFVSAFVSFIIMAYVNSVNWKIAGVSVAVSGLATGSVSIISLTSYFTAVAMSAFSTGAGIGMFAGAFYYTALTTWFCVSPQITLVVMSPLSILYLVSYYVINRNKDNKYLASVTHKEVAYTKIDDQGTEEEQDDDMNQESEMREDEPLTRKEKMLVIAKLFSLTVVPTFTAFFAQYLTTQTVITTIAYKNAPFRPRDHYQYYIFIFMSGELIGRSHRSLLSFINLRWIYTPTCKLLWILSAFQIMILFFLIFESWYRFLPSVAIVFVVCFCAGFAIGCFYLNMLELLHITLEGTKLRAFMTAYGMFPLSGGMLAAAFVGLYVEPRLLEHCITMFPDSAYCFTRPDNLIAVTLRCGRHIS